MSPTFEELVAEGDSVPVEGWDFSWFEGRATEERTPWSYARMLGQQLSHATSALDVETGGGEVFGGALAASRSVPAVVRATESWEPNLAIARRRLAQFGGSVEHVNDSAPLPFDDATFEVVSSRHPNVTPWAEIARVLAPGGTTITQQVVGMRTNRELYEFMLGQQHDDENPGAAAFADAIRDARLELLDLRYAESRLEFFDVAAVVYFLRKVLWTVPGFTSERYHDRLLAMHEHVQSTGSFVSYSRHALVIARKPA